MHFEGTDYVWFGDQPVAQAFTDPSEPTRYTFTDHLGTPILQTNATATIVWRAEYEPYGSVYSYRVATADDPQALRLPGQEAPDSGLSNDEYNIFRWYRSGWGRYTQNDPIPSVEPYGYTYSNPLRYIDPYGLRGAYPPPTQVPRPTPTPSPKCVPFIDSPPTAVPWGAFAGYFTVAVAVLSGTPAGGPGDMLGDAPRCRTCGDDKNEKHNENCDNMLDDDIKRCENWWLQRRVPNWRNYSACKGAAMQRYAECLTQGSPRSPLSPTPFQR